MAGHCGTAGAGQIGAAHRPLPVAWRHASRSCWWVGRPRGAGPRWRALGADQDAGDGLEQAGLAAGKKLRIALLSVVSVGGPGVAGRVVGMGHGNAPSANRNGTRVGEHTMRSAPGSAEMDQPGNGGLPEEPVTGQEVEGIDRGGMDGRFEPMGRWIGRGRTATVHQIFITEKARFLSGPLAV